MSATGRGTVVFAGLAPFMNGRISDREFMGAYVGGSTGPDLAEEAQRRGYAFTTLDLFLQHERWPEPALLLSDMGVGRKASRDRVAAAICVSLESPIIANRFYHDLRAWTAPFRHVFLWAGTRPRIDERKTRFHWILWPNEFRQVLADRPWNNRRFAVMVTGNKDAFRLFWRPKSFRFAPLVRQIGSMLWHAPRTWWIRRSDPWMQSGLHETRRAMVSWFGLHAEFDLYGQDWDKAPYSGFPPLAEALRRCYRGTIPPGVRAKVETVGGYRFCFCMENARFPGYITEKLFDALFAGSVPVYLGAPDVAEHVWPQCFVDAARFPDWSELQRHLAGLSDAECDRYREAGRAFLASRDFDHFYSPCYASRVMDAMDEVRDAVA